MYYQTTTAIIFSLLVSIFIIAVFGVIFTNNNANTFSIGIADNAADTSSRQLIQVLQKPGAFKIAMGDQGKGEAKLRKNDIYFLLVIPYDFVITPRQTNQITAYFDKAKAQNAQIGLLIIQNILASYNEKLFSYQTHLQIPNYITIKQMPIETNNLGFIDFFIPGMLAFSIMQNGLFGVAFSFTAMKKTGALNRLKVTPVKPANFIISQTLSRLVINIIQVFLILYLGVQFFKLHMNGNILYFLIVIILGSIIFLALGLGIAGYAKDESQAAPITNLVSLPMMFLSGVFFPTTSMPAFLRQIVSFLPLTYLSDAMRQIVNNGVSLFSIKTDLLGLFIWAIISIIIAVKLFKWE